MLLQIGDSRNTASSSNRQGGNAQSMGSLRGSILAYPVWWAATNWGGFGWRGSTSGKQFFMSLVFDSRSIGVRMIEHLLKA